MAIQQSINQLLSTAQIGAGFYAHLPEVQEERKRKRKLKEIGQEKEQLGKEKEVMAGAISEELAPVVNEAYKRIEEDNAEEAMGLIKAISQSPLQTEYSKLEKREKTLSKREEYYDPKLRIERMTERSEKAKETTLKALKEYTAGNIELEKFKEMIGVKEPKSRKGGKK